GGRGKLECDLRYAWDDRFLYVLVEQRAPAARVHEATDVPGYAAAPWDFDGVWLHLDLANGRLPSIGDVIWSMAFNSHKATDLFHAPALVGIRSVDVHTATSGSAEKNDRVIEARIAWADLLDYAF